MRVRASSNRQQRTVSGQFVLSCQTLVQHVQYFAAVFVLTSWYFAQDLRSGTSKLLNKPIILVAFSDRPGIPIPWSYWRPPVPGRRYKRSKDFMLSKLTGHRIYSCQKERRLSAQSV